MKTIKWLAFVALSVTMALFLAACGPKPAATVNGEAIGEQWVTDTIEALRSQSEAYTQPAAWATALASSDLTPESLRKSVIDSKTQLIVITQQAKKDGKTVDMETVNAQIEQAKTASATTDDAAFVKYLNTKGYATLADFTDAVTASAFAEQYYQEFTAPEPTQEELEAYVNANLAKYLESNPSDSYKIPKSGKIVFAKVPEDIVSALKTQLASTNKGNLFDQWISQLVEQADVVVNQMPTDLSYYVDMSLATSGAADSSSTQTPTSAGTSTADAVKAAVAAGLVIKDTTKGTGAEATDGSTVTVRYTGTLDDGTVFDSNLDEGYSFVLGTGGVIKGWDAGLVGLKVGGKRTLTIPAELAYGAEGRNSIPGGATLHFDVELVDVK
jgi:FKBP-type peptidyl-prolyl cis-trans isomerase